MGKRVGLLLGLMVFLLGSGVVAQEPSPAPVATLLFAPEDLGSLAGLIAATPAADSTAEVELDADAAARGLGSQSRSDMMVTITDVVWDTEGNPYVSPVAGSQFVAIHVVYEALRDDAFTGTWTAIDDEGFTREENPFASAGPFLQPLQRLQEGDKTQGWVGFDVASATTRVEFVESDIIMGDLVWVAER